MSGRNLDDVPVTEPMKPGSRDSSPKFLHHNLEAAPSSISQSSSSPSAYELGACGLLRRAKAVLTALALRVSDVNTHVCFERAIIGTVSVSRSGGGFGESHLHECHHRFAARAATVIRHCFAADGLATCSVGGGVEASMTRGVRHGELYNDVKRRYNTSM